MKLNASIITGSSIVVLMLFAGAVLGFTGQDFGSAAQAELSEATRLLQNARGFSCRHIGKVIDQCVSGVTESCDKINVANDWHFAAFNVDGFVDCKINVERRETLPAVPDDELVFPSADVWKQ